MLIDKAKEKDWLIYNTPEQQVKIKDAVVFRIEEIINESLKHKIQFAGEVRALNDFIFPSFLPFDNIVINYTDGLIWYHQANVPKYKSKIIFHCLEFHANELDYIKPEFFRAMPTPCIVINNKMQLENYGFYDQKEIISVNKAVNLYGEEAKQIIWTMIANLHRFLILLSCKNIIQEKTHPHEKIQKKRRKNNKLPLSSYYTLKIKPTSSNKDYEAKNLWSNRIHLCRGHIKTYTVDKPLFGKVVGNIWCPPHARGNKKLGVIHKDYQLT